MKSTLYAETFRNRGELVNRIMDAAAQIKNYPDIVERAVLHSFLLRAKRCPKFPRDNSVQNL